MKQILRLTLLLACGVALTAFAQTDSHSETPKAGVVLVNLFSPTYPPLARQARIAGEVEVNLGIRKDGSIQSAVVASGHPMLTPAALSSAQQSRFECRGCEAEVTPYSLIYSFQFDASPGWPCPEKPGPRITQSQNRITIAAEPAMVHPYFVNISARSAKCLYLWRCGSYWGGKDYYFYRVRSGKCLDLWNCGSRLREPFATCRKLHRAID
ncbi:MAG: TonB family protein [Candidatus Sulfotelmatobacter sp.]